MSYLDKAKDGAVETRKNSGGDSDESSKDLEGIEVDFEETPFVAVSPTTFVAGDFPVDEGNPIIRFRSPEYNEGRLDQGYLGLVLDDPEVIADEAEGTEDAVILETDGNDSTDYRVFNENDHKTKVAGDMGVKFGDRLYEGEIVDEIPSDRLILKISGTSAKNVAKRFDKKGAVEAAMDEETGNVNDGLIEYKPWDQREDGQNEVTSRYARDPELKADLYDSRIGVLLARREELDDEDTGYGTDHEDPDEASYAELCQDDDRPERSMYWYVTFNLDTGEEIEIEETDETVYGYTYLDDDWGQFDPEAGRMPDDQWEWVENYVEEASNGNVDTDEATIEGFIEEDDSEGAFEETPTESEREEMVSAIQNQV